MPPPFLSHAPLGGPSACTTDLAQLLTQSGYLKAVWTEFFGAATLPGNWWPNTGPRKNPARLPLGTLST